MLKFIKNFTLLTFIYIFISMKFNYVNLSLSDLICFMADNNKDINLHGHISVTKEAGKAIGQGLQTIGTQIGLGATITGVAGAVGKTIAKTSLPPLQKAGVVIGSGLLGGLIHSSFSQYNRNRDIRENVENNISPTIDNPNISKFIEESASSSPLEILLSNLELINYICVYMLIILAIQIIFKFYIKNSINLNLSSILGNKLNHNLELIINKIITLNKKMSTIYIWIILIFVIVSLSFSIFFITDIHNNLEDYIKVYESFKRK